MPPFAIDQGAALSVNTTPLSLESTVGSVARIIETDEQVLAARREAAEALKGRRRVFPWDRSKEAAAPLAGREGNQQPWKQTEDLGKSTPGASGTPELKSEERYTTEGADPHTNVAGSHSKATSTTTASIVAAVNQRAQASVSYAVSNLDYAMLNLASMPAVSSLATAMPARLAQFGIWAGSSSAAAVKTQGGKAEGQTEVTDLSLHAEPSDQGGNGSIPGGTECAPPPQSNLSNSLTKSLDTTILPQCLNKYQAGIQPPSTSSPFGSGSIKLTLTVLSCGSTESSHRQPSNSHQDEYIADRIVSVSIKVLEGTSTLPDAVSSTRWTYGGIAATAVGRLIAPGSWLSRFGGTGKSKAETIASPGPTQSDINLIIPQQTGRAVAENATSLSMQSPMVITCSEGATSATELPQEVPQCGQNNPYGGTAEDEDGAMLEDMRLVLLGTTDDGHPYAQEGGSRPCHSNLSGYPLYTGGREDPEVGGTEVDPGPPRALETPRNASDPSGVAGERPCFSGGTSIRLHFDLLPSCSELQLWNRQAGRCFGCHEALPSMLPQPQSGAQGEGRPAPSEGSSAIMGGYLWRSGISVSPPPDSAAGPRVCWYTGGLYCSECHRQQTAVLPSRVLRSWDFVPRPVCCVAHDYLVAIRDQPLLCITAINPGLYTR